MHRLLAICVLLATWTATARTSEASTTTSNPSPTSTIPPGYKYYAATGSYYKSYQSWVSWDVANTTCGSEGAHLLVVDDAVEAEIVARMVEDAGEQSTWTGLRDSRPGGVMEWSTVHGQPLSDVYHVWEDSRPLNDVRYSCARFVAYNKRLYDGSCDWQRYCTCEISR